MKHAFSFFIVEAFQHYRFAEEGSFHEIKGPWDSRVAKNIDLGGIRETLNLHTTADIERLDRSECFGVLRALHRNGLARNKPFMDLWGENCTDEWKELFGEYPAVIRGKHGNLSPKMRIASYLQVLEVEPTTNSQEHLIENVDPTSRGPICPTKIPSDWFYSQSRQDQLALVERFGPRGNADTNTYVGQN